jgi:uncharacterized protein
VSDLGAIRRFGISAAGAAFVEWAVIFFALPALRLKWINPAKAITFRFEPKRILPRYLLSAASIAVFASGLFGFTKLNYDDRVSRNFPSGHEYSLDLSYIRESRGWEGLLYVQFDDVTSLPHPDSHIDQVLAEIAKDANVVGVENPNDLLRFSTEKLPAQMSELALNDVSVSPTYRKSFTDDGRARATLYLKSSDLGEIRHTVSAIQNACRGMACRPVGESMVYLEYAQRVSRTLFESFAVSLALVGGVLLLLSFGTGIRTQLLILYTSCWGPVAMIGVMALFKTAINPVTGIFAAILVGLTGDNAIQYLFAGRDSDLESGVRRQASASVLLTMLLMLCSASFLGLTLVPLKTLGGLFLAGFALCLFGDLFLLNGLLRRRLT